MREPLPLYCLTSAAYAEAAAARRGPDQAARDAWTSEWKFDKEDKEPEHQLVLGGVRTLDDLLDEPPRADEEGDGWEVDETTRLGRYARRLWDALLPLEQGGMTLAPERAPFDVCGPLPTGVTVLEASAGTGKTYTIAALAARYVAEGTPLDRLLLVTFTRMATGELRERVRERLVSVERGLAPRARSPGDDPIVRLLADGPPRWWGSGAIASRDALSNFDAATIATTHGFCQEVLGGLGIAGDLEPDTTFVEDIDDLVEEVIDDLYVRRFHARDTPPFDRKQAAAIVWAAVGNPDAPLAAGHRRGAGDAPPARGSRARRARGRKRRIVDHDLRRSADPPRRRARG